MSANALSYFKRVFNAMGSPCEILLAAESKSQADSAIKAVISDVGRLEAKYSRYRNDSFLSDINRIAADGGRIIVDDETAGLLNYAAACYEQSGGLFDISSGILRRVWRMDRNELPEPGQVKQMLEHVGWHKLLWNAPVLEFPQPGMELDFGGVVKEYAADRAAGLCWEAGIRYGVINLGGDIKIIGPRIDGGPWRIGIRDPRNKDGVMRTVMMREGALASSGDYERCITVDGVRFGHVLNPKTGYPVRHLTAVSVIADFCVVAGSASTIAMLKEHDGPKWLAGLGLPYMWVDVRKRVGGQLGKRGSGK
ncbi:MAG: FAD:protein FMN transferase [Methylomonas sp.]|nr:FAD:protein FMN transferase [Methylomonas sp.]